ncbi:MAG TPA: sporulation protein YqfD [Candidatus Merdicola faecigallinarum]|uniref:Sporulation protein YqfD n=1 Tax=Candidatus Merdicola faecigallinarum TaxID=2840862 RepID=A0A9D1M2F2_9FIRM|nr:sporulation protein YqfD [Candidatus Merdicola faecigallinarum]
MIFKILMQYLLGYLKIEVEGYYIERFINICKAKQIFLWNLKRKNTSIMEANIGLDTFGLIREIARKTKCKVKIKNKKGIPFFLNRYKKRKIFFLCLLFIIMGILITSNFIWNIEITGNVEIPSEEILKSVNENGLKLGEYKGKIDTKKIINEVRLKREDIAWIGIEIKGTNAMIKIVETEKKPEMLDESDYCNIVADKEGVIEKVDANNGTIMVNVGDRIKEGSILIGGWMEGKYTGTRYVHASGEIKARVWYTEKAKVELSQKVREKTGKEEKKYRVKFHNFEINLYKKLSNFENYDTIYQDEKVKIFSNFYIPVEITTCHNFEIIEKEVNYTQEEAKELAKKEAEEKLQKEIQDMSKVQNKLYHFQEKDGYIEAEVTYEVLENIGTEEKIVF